MITLLTGAPGAGKTAELVNILSTLGDRPLFVHGLNGLKLPHFPIDAANWHNEVPDGAVLVVDEVQQVWRPRGSGSHAPAAVQAFETHRHRGIDVFFTTQQPKLLDSNIRALVGRHIHLRDTGWLGRWRYEWPECSENVAWKTCALKRRFKLPKHVFDLYRSASEHTSVQRGRSLMPFITVGLIAAFAVLLWLVVGVFTERRGAELPAPSPAVVGTLTAAPAVPATAAALHAAFTPRIHGRPETAPAYDELRKVAVMPRIQGGYCQGGRCRCFIQNALIAPITEQECAAWVANPPFDPYHARPEPRQDRYSADPPSATASGVPGLL